MQKSTLRSRMSKVQTWCAQPSTPPDSWRLVATCVFRVHHDLLYKSKWQPGQLFVRTGFPKLRTFRSKAWTGIKKVASGLFNLIELQLQRMQQTTTTCSPISPGCSEKKWQRAFFNRNSSCECNACSKTTCSSISPWLLPKKKSDKRAFRPNCIESMAREERPTARSAWLIRKRGPF